MAAQLDTELLAVGAAGAASLVLLGTAMRNARRDARLHRRLALLADSVPADAGALAPVVGMPVLDGLLLCIGKDREEVGIALRAADYYHPMAVTAFAFLRVSATVAGALLGALFLYHLDLLDGVARFYPLGVGGACFVVAKVVLRSRVTARTRHIGKEMPFVLDLMLLMLESGVSLDQCFRHFASWDIDVVPHSKRVMVALVDDLTKGMSYETALDRWGDRMCVKGARELSSLFRQAVLHGTELAPNLRGFVREFAETRIATAREVIGKKTTQMTMVMIAFLMPALFIVIGGPAVTAVFSILGELTK